MSDQNPTPPLDLNKQPEPQYTQPQYTQPQYTQPQNTPPQYAQPAPPYTQPTQQYTQPDPYAVYPQQAAQRTNTLAIVALVLSLTIPIGGIVTGHIALSQINRSGEAGRGLALAGMIIGYAYTALVILAAIAYIIFIVLIVGAAGVSSSYGYNA